MAYRFNGSSDYVEFSATPLLGIAVPDPVTLSILLKRGTLSTNQACGPSLMDSTLAASKLYQRFGTTDQPQFLPGPGNGPTCNSTSVWYLIALTAIDNVTPARWHIHDGTTWTHAVQSGTTWSGVASTIVSGDRLFAGKLGTALLPFTGDIVCIGVKKANTADVAVETLTNTAFSTWVAFGFNWLIGFDSSQESAGILQDQATPGTGDEIAISGTTQVSDPPGWSWASVATTSQIVPPRLIGAR